MRPAPTNAGSYKLVVSVANDNANYTGISDISFTIAPRHLTITGLTAANRVYDGTTAVTLTGGTLWGKVGSDDVTVTMPMLSEAEKNPWYFSLPVLGAIC